MKVNSSLSVIFKRIVFVVFGFLQGTIGNYLGSLGLVFAFPQTDPYSKDYNEDMFFVPFGYIMMLTWLIVTISAKQSKFIILYHPLDNWLHRILDSN